MNDRSLAALLAELEDQLGRLNNSDGAAREILDRVEAHVPGAILRSAATIQLRSLGCVMSVAER